MTYKLLESNSSCSVVKFLNILIISFVVELYFLKILRIMNSLFVIYTFPLAGTGWIVGAGFCYLSNLSTASGKVTSELHSSNFGTSLYQLLFLKVFLLRQNARYIIPTNTFTSMLNSTLCRHALADQVFAVRQVCEK